MQTKGDSIEVEVKLESKLSYVVGRNGTFTPSMARIWTGGGMAHIEADGKRGRLNAGLGIPPEQMDKLAMKWLQARGIMMPSGIGMKAG